MEQYTETEYPDSFIGKYSIHAEQVDDLTWRVSCREWKCELFTKNPCKEVCIISGNIAEHNDEMIKAGLEDGKSLRGRIAELDKEDAK